VDETEAENFYTKYYEMLAHPDTGSGSIRSSRSGPFWRIAELFPELRNPSGPIVEIGSGDGHRCAQLKDAGWPRVIGFELSRSRAARAQCRYPDVEIYNSTLQRSGLEPGSLQVILMEAVIEHLPNPLEQMRAIADFLKPGGFFVLTTPNMDSGHFKLLRSRWTPSLAPHVHLFLFGTASLKTLLTRAGLKPLIMGSFQDEPYEPMQYVRRALSGDLKGALWRAVQETGSFYGRFLGEGPLLFAVGRKTK
jgi:SAM-dependent methyltransferase